MTTPTRPLTAVMPRRTLLKGMPYRPSFDTDVRRTWAAARGATFVARTVCTKGAL